eukprot:6186068-Pleurochrysis_carterae.AAC.1
MRACARGCGCARVRSRARARVCKRAGTPTCVRACVCAWARVRVDAQHEHVCAYEGGFARVQQPRLVVSREECLELQNATLEVASGELVADVEPKRTKLAPVLQQRMEAAQPVQQLLKFLLLRVRVEVRIGEVVVRSEQIHFDATRRFDGHFDRILEDKHWEFVRWHRREPKSVVAVHL